jgi:hypothetical protein
MGILVEQENKLNSKKIIKCFDDITYEDVVKFCLDYWDKPKKIYLKCNLVPFDGYDFMAIKGKLIRFPFVISSKDENEDGLLPVFCNNKLIKEDEFEEWKLNTLISVLKHFIDGDVRRFLIYLHGSYIAGVTR